MGGMWTRSKLGMNNIFPLYFINIDSDQSHTAQFTHSFLAREFLAESTT